MGVFVHRTMVAMYHGNTEDYWVRAAEEMMALTSSVKNSYKEISPTRRRIQRRYSEKAVHDAVAA